MGSTVPSSIFQTESNPSHGASRCSESLSIERRSSFIFLEKKSLKLFKLFRDKAVRYKENTDIQRDSVTHLWDAYQTSIDRGQNEIMKLFTVVTSVFLPMTVIVGWYGMNFKYMPEISFRYGYVYVILLNIAVVLTLIYIFKKKKWI